MNKNIIAILLVVGLWCNSVVHVFCPIGVAVPHHTLSNEHSLYFITFKCVKNYNMSVRLHHCQL